MNSEWMDIWILFPNSKKSTAIYVVKTSTFKTIIFVKKNRTCRDKIRYCASANRTNRTLCGVPGFHSVREYPSTLH